MSENKGNINTSDSAFKMSAKSCGLCVPEETELTIPQPSNQIKQVESEVKSLQTDLEEERSGKKRMQEAHQSEVSAPQMELKDLKEELAELQPLQKKMESETEHKGHVIIEIPEQSPAPRTQGKGFLRRCAHGLLRAGLAVGIATAGAITAVYLASGFIEMVEPYCDRYYITPPPF